MKNKKGIRRNKIKMRIRKRISGTDDKPRLSVFRSNKQIYAQVINDLTGHTLAAASSREAEIAAQKLTKIEVSQLVGKQIATKAREAGIETVIFDRNGYLYHGRVKALADAAREAGLKF